MTEHGSLTSPLGGLDDLTSLLEQAPIGFVAAEAGTGRLVLLNDEAARLLGRPRRPPRYAADLAPFALHADGTPYAPDAHPLARALAGASVRSQALLCRRRDGVLTHLVVSAAPVRAPSGAIRGAVMTFSEVAASLRSALQEALPETDGEREREASAEGFELDRFNASIRALSEGLEEKVQLAYQAQHDPLTGLPNRVLFEERLERAVASAERYQRKLALLLLDLDGFAFVNEAFGHDAGDRVLKEVARRLQAGLRRSDTLARYGGDEFIVLVPELTEVDGAKEVALALASSMIEPFEVPGNRVVLTASVGVSIYPDDARDAAELKRHADAAVYHAQEPGSNGISIYGSPDRFELFASDLYRR